MEESQEISVNNVLAQVKSHPNETLDSLKMKVERMIMDPMWNNSRATQDEIESLHVRARGTLEELLQVKRDIQNSLIAVDGMNYELLKGINIKQAGKF